MESRGTEVGWEKGAPASRLLEGRVRLERSLWGTSSVGFKLQVGAHRRGLFVRFQRAEQRDKRQERD